MFWGQGKRMKNYIVVVCSFFLRFFCAVGFAPNGSKIFKVFNFGIKINLFRN